MEIVKIAQSVGKDANNKEEDVKKIQTILNLVRIGPDLEVNGLCDQDTISAIGNFQRIWRYPDYRIDPNGRTIQRLNDTIKPLIFKKIELHNIRQGGYAITYRGFVPPRGYKVMFYLLTSGPQSFFKIPDDAIDITTEGLDNKETTVKLKFGDTLPKLLALIAREEVWGSSIPCRIYLVHESGSVISESNEVNIQCPVKPYDGPIQLNMAEIDPPMYYTGSTLGRYFWPEIIDGKYYFAYASKFETDPKKRGFDCTTYVGTILNLNPLRGEMNGDGGNIADIIGADRCEFEYKPGKIIEMENIDKDMLLYFFTNISTGAFIVWTPSHVVLVVNGLVHEFNISNGPPGYYKREVRKRPWPSGKILHIRRIPPDRI